MIISVYNFYVYTAYLYVPSKYIYIKRFTTSKKTIGKIQVNTSNHIQTSIGKISVLVGLWPSMEIDDCHNLRFAI